MVRPRTDGLTDHELKIMNMFWELGPQTVQEIVDGFEKDPKPAYSSILTALRALTKKGYLSFKQEGKAYVYTAKVDKDKVLRKNITRIVNQFFDGHTFDLAVQLVKSERLTKSEKKRLQKELES